MPSHNGSAGGLLNLSKTIKRLERRATFLEDRVSSSPFDLSFDKSELSALRQAIEILHERQDAEQEAKEVEA